MTGPLVLELHGRIPSKKNSYTPRKDGKGFFKSTDLKTQLDRLAMQIPGWARDLKLVHPDLHFHFTYTKANWDRDNACTTLMDLMVQMGTLENDNISSSNGTTTIHPAERGEDDMVKIIIFPRSADGEEASPSRYIDPRRKRRAWPILIDVTPPEPVRMEFVVGEPAAAHVDLAQLEDYTGDDLWEW